MKKTIKYVKNQKKNMKYQVEERVLHIIYEEKDKKEKEFMNLYHLSKAYEGVEISVSSIVGYNFPMKSVPKGNVLDRYRPQCDYIIVYKKGDKHTKMHELQHAKYAMDPSYKKSIDQLWDSLSPSYQKTVIGMLRKMGYDDRMEILMDEFQAYYYTEKANFFGKMK